MKYLKLFENSNNEIYITIDNSKNPSETLRISPYIEDGELRPAKYSYSI